MNDLYNVFLELYKIPVVRASIYVIIVGLAFIGCYNVGNIVGKTFGLLFS